MLTDETQAYARAITNNDDIASKLSEVKQKITDNATAYQKAREVIEQAVTDEINASGK